MSKTEVAAFLDAWAKSAKSNATAAKYEAYYAEVSATWAPDDKDLRAKAVTFLRASDELRDAVLGRSGSDSAVAPLIVAVWGQMWVARRVIPGLLYYTRPYIDAVAARADRDDWELPEPYLSGDGLAFNNEIFRQANANARDTEDDIEAAIERGLKG